MGGGTGVEGAENGAVGLGHDVDGAVGEVNDAFEMAEGPGAVIDGSGGVAGVGTAGGVAPL